MHFIGSLAVALSLQQGLPSDSAVHAILLTRVNALRERFTKEERRRSESNRRIEVLQTSALPLGYGARPSKAHQKGLLHQVGGTSKHPLIVF